MPLFKIVVLAVVAGFTIGFIVCELLALLKWQSAWRVAAAATGAAYSFAVAEMLVHIFRDPTSHNLWPFDVVIFSALGLAVLGVLALVRMAVTARGQR